jgi:hypothetical protein
MRQKKTQNPRAEFREDEAIYDVAANANHQITGESPAYHIEAAVLNDEHANHERKHGGHVDAEKVARGLELQTVGRTIAIVGLDVELTGARR